MRVIFQKLKQVALNRCFSNSSLTFSRTMACQDLASMSPTEVKTFFDSYDTVLTDCDGVLWKGNNPIEGSPEMIHKFREMGKRVIYVTNNSTKTRKDYVKKCADLGFGGSYKFTLPRFCLLPTSRALVSPKKFTSTVQKESQMN